MSGNSFGQIFKITTCGESHGGAVGVIIDGCPPGLEISVEYIQEDELVEVTPTKVRMCKHPDHKEWAKRRRSS